MQEQAEQAGVRCFVPMRSVLKDDSYRISETQAYAQEPVIPSLIFMRSTVAYMESLRRDPNSHAAVYCTPGTRYPEAIPDREMELFIFALTRDCTLLESVDPDFKRGDHVRVTGGVLCGAEGYITRVHGTKRFVVVIEGVAAIATGFIPKHFIEKIE